MPLTVRNEEERVALHQAFWNRTKQDYPLAAFRVAPDFFFSKHFKAAESLLVPNKLITPDMLDVDRFLPDYEQMYEVATELGQDAFWAAEPFTGIPWMEAILGCEIVAGEESFISRPWMESLDDIDKISFDPNNPWLLKYLEFTRKLVELSNGRFPIGMPIMRGPADIVGAIMGQVEMVLALVDECERMKEFFLRVTNVFLRVISAQNELIPPFLGGTALGFYHVYCPGPSIWYQEDLSAIMSPALYREFLTEPERMICAGHDFTAIHLHPASFFLLDDLLAKEDLKAIEVNKDVGGPSIKEMLPSLRKIKEKKCLILWGDLDADDIRCLQENLTASGLFLFLIAPDMKTARELLTQIRAWPTTSQRTE
jgi:hypothetical protein